MIAEIETVSPADALIAAHPELGALYPRNEIAERLETFAVQLVTAGRLEGRLRRGESDER